MQLGALSRWLKRDARVVDEPLFQVSVDGRGPDVMLIHGLAASPECWAEARAELGPDLRLHVVHMRGFAGLPPAPGRAGPFLPAMADGLAAYLRRESRGPTAVLGHSMGGIVALMLARDHADIVDRLMVADVPSFFSLLISPFATAASAAGLAQAARRRYLEKDAAGLADELRRNVRSLVTGSAAVDPILRWGLESDQQTVADVMAEVMTTDLRPDLGSIRLPADVVYAWDRRGHSARAGLDQLYASAYAGLPDHRRIRIDDARHYIMLDQPQAFYAAVRRWLARG